MSQSSNKKNNNTFSSNQIDFGLLENSLGYLVRRAQLKIFQEFNYFFEALDIKPAQFSALEIIHNNPGLRQSALAKALNIQRTNMVGMLDQLQNRGLIERKPSTKDLRAHALHLTKKGEKFLKHLHLQFHQHEDLLLQRLGEENLNIVKDNLKVIVKSPKLTD